MALGRRKNRKQPFIPPKLQITSMMDMFTIILIFLLFSFSDKPETIKLDKNLELPVSNAKLDYSDHIKLVLSQNSLYLGEERIAGIQDGKIEGLNTASPKESKLYKELAALHKAGKRKKQEQDKQDADGRKEDLPESILFLCDRRLSFKTVNSIIKTAGMAGYPNFQFGVLKND